MVIDKSGLHNVMAISLNLVACVFSVKFCPQSRDAPLQSGIIQDFFPC